MKHNRSPCFLSSYCIDTKEVRFFDAPFFSGSRHGWPDQHRRPTTSNRIDAFLLRQPGDREHVVIDQLRQSSMISLRIAPRKHTEMPPPHASKFIHGSKDSQIALAERESAFCIPGFLWPLAALFGRRALNTMVSSDLRQATATS
jgi:hypothetical protein